MEQSDIVNIIIETINTIFNNLFSSIDNNIYSNLDKITFIDSDIMSNTFFMKLLGSNGKNGILYLTDAILVGISVFYCIKYFYSNMVECNIEKPSQFVFKILIFGIAINFSYFLLEQLLNISYLISSSIQSIGKEIIGYDINFSELIIYLNKKIDIANSSLNLFSYDGIIKSIISVGLLNLLFSYSIRYILLQVFFLLSPFALLSLINFSTSWFFKAWSKCLFSLLIVQIFIPIIIIVIFCIDDNNKILLISGIFVLTRINDYIRDIFGGIGLNAVGNFNSMVSTLKK